MLRALAWSRSVRWAASTRSTSAGVTWAKAQAIARVRRASSTSATRARALASLKWPAASAAVTTAPRDRLLGSGPRWVRWLVTATISPASVAPIQVPPETRSTPLTIASPIRRAGSVGRA